MNEHARQHSKKPRTKITYIPQPLPETGLVRLPTVLAYIQIGKTSWWQGVREGRYPQPVKLGPRLTVWKVEDIRRLIVTGDVG